MYRRCFTHQSSPPHQDGPGRRAASVEQQRAPGEGDDCWPLLLPPVSIVERRRTRWMAIAAEDDNFYDDIFGGSEGRWRTREGSFGDDRNAGRDLEGKHRSRSSDRSPAAAKSSEDRNLCARSLRSLVAFEEEEEPSCLPSKLRYSSPAPAARLAPRRDEASLSRTSAWLQDLNGCGNAALRHAHVGENSSRLCLSEAISVSTSSMWSVRKVQDGETSTEFNISPLSPASADCERAVDRRLMSREERKALEELERAVVLDVDDIDCEGDDGDEDEDDGAAMIDVRGGSHHCRETEMSEAVDEAIAWARERFLSGRGRKVEEPMESGAGAEGGGRCEE